MSDYAGLFIWQSEALCSIGFNVLRINNYFMVQLLGNSMCFQLVLIESFVMVWQVLLVNLSKVNPTAVNNVPIQDTKVVTHNDVFTAVSYTHLTLPTIYSV